MVEQWNRDGGTLEHLMVEQWKVWWCNSRISDGGTVEQRWWNSKISDGEAGDYMMVEQLNRDGRTVEHLIVEQWNIWWWNSGTSYGGTVEHLMVEQWNIWWWNSRTSDGGTVEHVMVEQWIIWWWNSRTSDGGAVEDLMVEPKLREKSLRQELHKFVTLHRSSSQMTTGVALLFLMCGGKVLSNLPEWRREGPSPMTKCVTGIG